MNNPRLTCDWCRAKKIRCVEIEAPPTPSPNEETSEPTCRACWKRKVPCTFEFSHKRPGRPAGNRRENRRASDVVTPPHSVHTGCQITPTQSLPNLADNTQGHSASIASDLLVSHNWNQPSEAGPSTIGPAAWSLWGSAKSVFMPDMNGDPLLQPTLVSEPSPLHQLDQFVAPIDVDAALEELFAPIQNPAQTFSTGIALNSVATEGSTNPESIEAIAPWGTICFFLSIHVRHHYALVPLVHKPSFAQDLLYRRDLIDETFRGFLCSIITHTICQTPMRLMQADYTIQYLEDVVSKSRRMSRALQIKYQNRLNYDVAASIVLDMITSQSTSTSSSADLMASEARRVIYALRYHLAEPHPGMTLIEKELARRLFWEAYCVDKTCAINGSPILFHDLEGTPPYPVAVEDEYITRTGIAAPSSNTNNNNNIIAFEGSLTILELFRLLYSATMRHRAQKNCPPNQMHATQEALLQWTKVSLARINELLEALPEALKISNLAHNPALQKGVGDEGHATAIGIQQANIYVTALVTKLAVIGFKGDLSQNSVAQAETEAVAQESFKLLSSIPIEYLAANGESMRGKVLRVILALQTATANPADLGGAAWDWWNMYSRVRYLQIIPAD